MAVLQTPTIQTFAVMQTKLRNRLGLHASLGSLPALDDILTEAQDYVYAQLDNGMPTESTLQVWPNTTLFDWESDNIEPIAPSSVQEVWAAWGSNSRVPLAQGITHAMRAANTSGQPQRYDTQIVDGVAMIELWPAPDQNYTLHIKHNRVMSRFEQAADKPCVPQRLLFAYALAVAKAHYKQADAEVSGQAFKTMLSKAKAQQHENRRYLREQHTGSRARLVAGSNGTHSVVYD